MPANLKAFFTAALLFGVTLAMSGCAEYIQDAEAVAQKGITNQQRIDDDFAKGVSIAPQAIPSGALARFPAGPQKCALATLAGLELNGCTAATTQDVQNIIQQQMNVHFGPAAVPPPATSPAPPATTTVVPFSAGKTSARSANGLADVYTAAIAQQR